MAEAAASDLAFPQQASSNLERPNPTTELTQRAAGPNYFRDGENVQFMRAESVKSHGFNDGVLHLQVRSAEYTNRTAQTHDSVMHQFIEQKDSFGAFDLKIQFFTEDIFRVQFADQLATLDALKDEPLFPPPEARMLIGKRKHIDVQFEDGPEEMHLRSTNIKLRIQRKPFQLKAYKLGCPTPFWRQRLSDLFTSDAIPTSIASHDGRRATFEAFTLDPNEALFGLGERFDAVGRRGRPVDFVNHDAIGTSNPRSYINVPFFWSTNGYGCFVNSHARTEWDMGMSESGTVGFSTEETFMDYFIVEGQTPAEILGRYTRNLTGTAPLPPIWSFGLWLSRNSYQSWSVVDEVVSKCKEHKIPLDTVHLDTAWFKEDWNADLIFSKERFANHEQKMASLLKEGIHVSLWQYTFIPPREDNSLFVEARDGGYLGMKRLEDGSRGSRLFTYPEDTTGWRVDDAVIDFSNPKAVAWYGDKISSLIEQGASAIKTDFGDCIPPDAHYENIEGRRFQNLYSLAYNATIHAAISKVKNDTVLWARSGTAGSQRYPLHWGGDSQCSWSALQGSLRATLSVGLSGFAYHSHDIGGFIGKPSPELYVRWAQLVLMSSHSRSHGAGDENGREPWFFGDRAVDIFRKFTRMRYNSSALLQVIVSKHANSTFFIRYQLLPYIISQAKHGGALGLPLVRAMILEYPQDRNCWSIETQYHFGSDLLIAPVLTAAEDCATQDVYLPAGTWFDFWTKEKTTSRGEWITRGAPALDTMPIWVRGGAMIAWAEERERTFNSVGKIQRIELYGEREGAWRCEVGTDLAVEVIADESGRWTCQDLDGVQFLHHV